MSTSAVNPRGIEDLPPKIVDLLKGLGIPYTKLLFATKTKLKPNATIPILWLVIESDSLILCSTHKTRGLFKRIGTKEIDSIRITNTTSLDLSYMEVIHKNLAHEDLRIPIQSNACLDLKDTLKILRIQSI